MVDAVGRGSTTFGHVRLGGIAQRGSRPRSSRAPASRPASTILGHLLRGGTPTAFDRILATRFGLAGRSTRCTRAIRRRWSRCAAPTSSGSRSTTRCASSKTVPRAELLSDAERVLRIAQPSSRRATSPPLDDLLELLELEPLEVNLFRGRQPRRGPATRLRRAGRGAGAGRRGPHGRARPAGRTRCTRTSCGPAIPTSRSSTRSTASATAAASRRAGSSRSSTARRSSTSSASFQVVGAGARPRDGDARRSRARRTLPTFRERLEPYLDRFGRRDGRLADARAADRLAAGRRSALARADAARARAGRLDPGQRRPCPTTRCCTRASSRTRRTCRCSTPRRCRTRSATAGSTRWRASTTRCGSTARSAPTSGCCTTRSARRRRGARASRSGTCSARDGTLAVTVMQEGSDPPGALTGPRPPEVGRSGDAGSCRRAAPSGRVDLRSDTVTTPTPEMRRAMADAEVGDDALRRGPDGQPARSRSPRRCSARRPRCYVPSGTMANQLALRVLGRRGTEVLCGERAHVFRYEAAAAAGNAGVQLRPLPDDDGVLGAAAVESRPRPTRHHHLPPISARHDREHPHARERAPVAPGRDRRGRRRRRRATGSRCTATARGSGTRRSRSACAPAELAAPADTVMFCLSKGLGAPVGSLLCGPAARRSPRPATNAARLGGGMRQAGVIAAAGIVALETMVERLADDHARARRLADALGRPVRRQRRSRDGRDQHRVRRRSTVCPTRSSSGSRTAGSLRHDRRADRALRDPQGRRRRGPGPTVAAIDAIAARSPDRPASPGTTSRRRHDGASPDHRLLDRDSAARPPSSSRSAGTRSSRPHAPEMLDDLDVAQTARARRRRRRVGRRRGRRPRASSTRS